MTNKTKLFHYITTKICILVVSFIIQGIITGLPAQQNEVINEDTTSIQTVSNTFELLRKADSIRLADSIQKIILTKQLEELKSNEYSKRRRLEKEMKRLTFNDSIKKVRLKNEIDSLKKTAQGFPVVPYKDTLFRVYTGIGIITAQERAQLIEKRLKTAYKQYMYDRDSLAVVNYGQSVDIVWGEKSLLSISEPDAIWFEKPKIDIANRYQAALLKDIEIYKDDKNLFSVLKEVGLVLLVLALLFGAIKLINQLYKKKVIKKIISMKDSWFTGFNIRNYQLLDADSQVKTVLFLFNIVRYLFIAFLLYVTIPIIFSIFPPTKTIADKLFGYILSPVKTILYSILSYIPNLITIAVIAIAFRYLIKGVRFLSLEVEQEKLKIPGFYPDWAKPTFNIIRVLLNAFMIVMIFPLLPRSNSEIFKGVSVFLGIMISIGSSSAIGNLVSGLVITYMRPFKIGDRIKIGETIGDVIEKTPFVTRVKTPKNEFITIPNSSVLASSVVNYSTTSSEEGIILHTTITIGYDVPWRKVHELLIGAAIKTNHIKSDPAPFVLQTSLDDFYVSYQLNAYSSKPDRQPRVYSELHQHIQDLFNEAGVEIMSPHYRGNRNGDESTIPRQYWEQKKGNKEQGEDDKNS